PDEGGLDTQLMIEIVGSGGFYGFYYNCCAASYITITLQGVAMHGFLTPLAGQTGTATTKAKLNLYGSFIGTKIDGTALPEPGNSNSGVVVGYDDAQIGGTQPWQRNLLSGNTEAVSASGPNASVIIEGNLIGTDAGGTSIIGNTSVGLRISGNLPGVRV